MLSEITEVNTCTWVNKFLYGSRSFIPQEIICYMELLYKHMVIKVHDDLNHNSCGRKDIVPSAIFV